MEHPRQVAHHMAVVSMEDHHHTVSHHSRATVHLQTSTLRLSRVLQAMVHTSRDFLGRRANITMRTSNRSINHIPRIIRHRPRATLGPRKAAAEPMGHPVDTILVSIRHLPAVVLRRTVTRKV